MAKNPISPDNFSYAMQSTRIIFEPDRRIDTFGDTEFHYTLISELMDKVGVVKIRSGKVEARRPHIIHARPDGQQWEFEGFGEKADEFSNWLKQNAANMALLNYAFAFRRDEVKKEIVHSPLAEVCEKARSDAKSSGDPMSAVIQGVEDAWEVSLLKFTFEMIAKSLNINLFDFKRRGLL